VARITAHLTEIRQGTITTRLRPTGGVPVRHAIQQSSDRVATFAKRYYYEAHDQLKRHLHTFLMASGLARQLKTLRGPTPHEHIGQQWQKDPELFHRDPYHHAVGRNT